MSARQTLVLCLLLPACAAAPEGETPTAFEGPPFSTVTTAPQALELALRFSPDRAPVRGVNAIELQIADALGATREGMDVAVVPWMPAMNHGSSVQPSVSAIGEGRYVVDHVSVFMPGRWQLRIAVTDPTTAAVDHGTAEIDVP